MISVTADSVRYRINLSSSDIPDAKVTQFIEDSEVEVELETDLEIDYSNCTPGQAAYITDLAALYCLAYLTGGSASGTNFTIGDLCQRSIWK